MSVSACGGGSPQEPAPASSASEGQQNSTLSAEALALDAYRGMWRAYAKAGLEANPDEPGLARYAAGRALQTLKSGLSGYRSKGQVLKGEYRSAPQAAAASPEIPPTVVTVTDCLDDSKFLVYDAAGKPVDDAPGGRRVTRATVTDLGSEGWKVTSFGIQRVGTC